MHAHNRIYKQSLSTPMKLGNNFHSIAGDNGLLLYEAD